MASTYTSNWIRVSHGDVTTHNPQSLASTNDDIIINSAQVRWEGIDVTKTITDTNIKFNETIITRTLDDTTSVYYVNANLPTLTNGYTIDSWEVNAWAMPYITSDNGYDSNDSITILMVADGKPWGKETSNTETWYGGDNTLSSKRAVENYATSNDYSGQEVEARFQKESGVNVSTDLECTAVLNESKTYDKTYSTTDPRVTRDVTGDSGGITLNDGEQSSWFTLSGLDPNSEEFYHDIDGSGEAYFQFEFTWEQAYPDAVGGYWSIYDESQNAIHRVALADPADSLLDYNHHRFAINGTVYALDVVDPSDADAITWRRWYHPTYGIYCPRATETIQL